MSIRDNDFAGLWVDPTADGEEIDPCITIGYEDEIRAAAWLDHRPGQGYPRQGMPREVAFADAWERYMRSSSVPNLKLWRITSDFYHLPDQQVATLFATIFTWLGTNVGSSMVRDAEGQQRYALVRAWAVENLRISWLDHGIGTLDHLVERLGWDGQLLPANLIRATFQLMYFLDHPNGRLLIEYAQDQYERIRHEPRFRPAPL